MQVAATYRLPFPVVVAYVCCGHVSSASLFIEPTIKARHRARSSHHATSPVRFLRPHDLFTLLAALRPRRRTNERTQLDNPEAGSENVAPVGHRPTDYWLTFTTVAFFSIFGARSGDAKGRQRLLSLWQWAAGCDKSRNTVRYCFCNAIACGGQLARANRKARGEC